MLELTYKRAEKIIVALMILGLVAMFQPWFENLVELFEPLAPDARLGRTYRREIAPVIFRYGFYATFLSTIAFTALGHYSVDDLRRAAKEKGLALTTLLMALPLIYGFSVILNLAWDRPLSAILQVINFICAIAVWNFRRWGLFGLGLVALAELGLFQSDSVSLNGVLVTWLWVIILLGLAWPKRSRFN